MLVLFRLCSLPPRSQPLAGNACLEALPPELMEHVYMGKSRYRIANSGNQPYFVTCTVMNWTAIFNNTATAHIIFASLQFLQAKKRLYLHGYILLENHLHLIVSAPDLSKELGLFKSFTARSIIDLWVTQGKQNLLAQFKFCKAQHKKGQIYQLWQEGSHPQALVNEAMFSQKLAYIHHNPVRRGYVDDPAHWRYSSYQNYHGQEGVLAIQPVGYVEPLLQEKVAKE